MRLLYLGAMWHGSTTLQRLQAFSNSTGVHVVPFDTGARLGQPTNLYKRIRWKLCWPVDEHDENKRLVSSVTTERPDAVFIDSSRVIRGSTLELLRKLGVKCLVYYTPDDIIGAHNLSWPLRLTFPFWDVFFTTKTFNIPELKARGVRRPILIGKAFDPNLHKPLSREEVGDEYERFDVVFMGACEHARASSINSMAEAGLSAVVYGGRLGGWLKGTLHKNVTLREARFGQDYTKAMHHGKIALCFLRKMNRDRITQRTMEIAAMGRPMLAEKTDEHDQHFADGAEYVGFRSDEELIEKAHSMLSNNDWRIQLSKNILKRCHVSGYSTNDRANEMLEVIRERISRGTPTDNETELRP